MTAEAMTLARGERRRSLAAIMANAFCVGLVVGMTGPLIALFLERQGFDSITIGLNAAAYSCALLLTGSLVPVLVGRFGAVPTLAFGLALGAGCLAAFPFAAALGLLFLLRIALGAGNAIDWVVSETWINLLAGGRGRVIATYTTLWGGGMAAGPLLLGIVGVEGSTPFLLAAGILAVSFVPVILARSLAPPMPGSRSPAAFLRLARAAPLAIAPGFLAGYGENAFLSLFPIYAVRQGFDEGTAVLFATAFAAGAVLLQPAVGWLADRLEPARLLVGLVIAVLACTVVVPFVLATPAVWPVLVLWGAAFGGFYTVGLILLGRSFQPAEMAAANTAFIMSYTTGMIIGPAMAGVGMRLWAPHGLLVVMAMLYVLFLAAASAGLLRRG